MKELKSQTKNTPILDNVSWNVIKEQAIVLVKSGFLPSSIKTPEQAIAVALKGYELGLPIMLSYSHINIIQGKPTISSELMLALIHKNCPGAVVNFIKMEDDECVLEASRPGSKLHTFKFDIDDATAAGLTTKTIWKQYPRSMHKARTVSEMARTLFPDVIMGCSYTPEELFIDTPITVQHESSLTSIPSQTTLLDPLMNSSDNNKKYFDINNIKHVDKINKILKEKSVPNDLWKKVYEKMEGRKSFELDEALNEIYKEMSSINANIQEDDFFDIPFSPDPLTTTDRG